MWSPLWPTRCNWNKSKHEYEVAFMETCAALATFAGDRPIASAGLCAMIGAAETLSALPPLNRLSPTKPRDELFDFIVSLLERSDSEALRGRR